MSFLTFSVVELDFPGQVEGGLHQDRERKDDPDKGNKNWTQDHRLDVYISMCV